MEELSKAYKKFVATIYLSGKSCVRSIANREEISNDPVKLAKFYEDNGADEILIFDLSRGEEEHESALSYIRKITSASAIPSILCPRSLALRTLPSYPLSSL